MNNKSGSEVKGKCVIWTGSRNASGYGLICSGNRRIWAHRAMYEGVFGRIPKGLVIDHLCRVTSCINPNHLRAVTNKVNILCGIGPTAQNAKKNKCPYGHEYLEKVYTNGTKYPGGKYRDCIPCRRQRWHKLNYYVSTGAIIKPKNCSKCHKKCSPRGYCPDYSKPLKVRWLCATCLVRLKRSKV